MEDVVLGQQRRLIGQEELQQVDERCAEGHMHTLMRYM